MGFIYKIVNKTDNKIYIGQTRGDLNERWRNHMRKTSNCRYLSNALQKYGKENFDFKMIIVCFDEDLDYYEKEYIQKYNSLVPNGYNLKKGGNASNHHEDTKRKIAGALTGKKTNIRPMLGKHHSEEIKKKISEKMKGRKPKGFSNLMEYQKKSWKSIVQLDENKNIINTFKHSVEAAKLIGCNKASIHYACKKELFYKGFYWYYKSKIEILSLSTNNNKNAVNVILEMTTSESL